MSCNNTNEYKYSFFPRTTYQWNSIPKWLVDSETVNAFQTLFEGSQLLTLVALATLAFILQWEFLLIIYSDSDSDSDLG